MADRPLVILRPVLDVKRENLLALHADLQALAGDGVQILVIPTGVDVVQPVASTPDSLVSPPLLSGDWGKDWNEAVLRRLGLLPPKPKTKWWWPFRSRAASNSRAQAAPSEQQVVSVAACSFGGIDLCTTQTQEASRD